MLLRSFLTNCFYLILIIVFIFYKMEYECFTFDSLVGETLIRDTYNTDTSIRAIG